MNLRVAGQAIRAVPSDDLTFQATTRGGRQMDHVLANKAVLKGSTDAFGNAAIVSGSVLAIGGSRRHSAADEIGAGLLVAGVIAKLVSSATTPSADVRMWDNLPNYIGFSAFQVPPGEQRLSAEFIDAAGRITLKRDVTFTVSSGGRDTVLFLSDRH